MPRMPQVQSVWGNHALHHLDCEKTHPRSKYSAGTGDGNFCSNLEIRNRYRASALNCTCQQIQWAAAILMVQQMLLLTEGIIIPPPRTSIQPKPAPRGHWSLMVPAQLIKQLLSPTAYALMCDSTANENDSPTTSTVPHYKDTTTILQRYYKEIICISQPSDTQKDQATVL